MKHPLSLWKAALAALLLAAPLLAQRDAGRRSDRLVEKDPKAAPIARALAELGPEVQVFNRHVETLANPFMEGRVPGSRGMEIAREYFEYYLRKAGTLPPFVDEQGRETYRQRFPMPSRVRTVTAQRFEVGGWKLAPGTDFNVLGLGASGEATGPLAFVGYAVEEGADDYTSFPEDERLEGKIALAFRFEPMNADGESKWARRGRPWSRNVSLSVKTRNLARRGAAGVVYINPPGCADPRAQVLMAAGSGGRQRGEFPVVHLGTAAARRLLELAAPTGTTLESLREAADEKGAVIDLPHAVTIAAELKTERLFPENVGGMIPGKGVLKDEWIVIGAHLDHLGVGRYGARDRSRVGQLHPGADDNASGSAGVLMLAEKLAEDYRRMPDDAAARSLLLVGWDAEEAGLWGSRHYVEEPIAPLEKHALCINFDMIGRIVNKRLSVSGANSAKGMAAWLEPILERSPLDVVEARIPGGSDHMAFMAKKIPYLFAIIADFHRDYHTPDDVSWKINREDAVHTVRLFHEIALAAATRSEPFEWSGKAGWNMRRGKGRRRRGK